MRAVLGISKPIPVSIPFRGIADATFDGSNIPGTFQHMRWPRCHASGSAMAGISCTRLTTKLAFHLAYSLREYQGHRVPHIRCTIRSKSTRLPMEALRTSSPLCQRNERKYYLDPVKDGTSGAAFLVVAVVMSVFSALIGIGWTIVKIAVLVGVVAGVVHIARRHRQVRSGDQPGMLSK